MSPVIQLSNIDKSYPLMSDSQPVLKNLNFQVDNGDMVSIMGRSGSGKSTLLNILGLLDKPDSGKYLLDGSIMSASSSDELARLRNQLIGFVFQSFFLLPKMTAFDNIALPLQYRGLDTKTIQRKVNAMLEQVGMLSWSEHRPAELSGGQQQRVAIARALVTEPKLILADEPTGALDAQTSEEILSLFLHLNETLGTTLVMITHDFSVAQKCHTQWHMPSDGTLIKR